MPEVGLAAGEERWRVLRETLGEIRKDIASVKEQNSERGQVLRQILDELKDNRKHVVEIERRVHTLEHRADGFESLMGRVTELERKQTKFQQIRYKFEGAWLALTAVAALILKIVIDILPAVVDGIWKIIRGAK